MARDRRQRHPFLDNLVFALALLLGLVVGFYGLRMVLSGAGPAARPGGGAAAPAVVEKRGLASSGTGDAVGTVPPIRIARTGRLRTPSAAVPAPSPAPRPDQP